MLVDGFHHPHLLQSMYSQFILTMFEIGIENLANGTFSSNFQGMKIPHLMLYWGWPLRNRGLRIKWLLIAFKGLEKDIGRPLSQSASQNKTNNFQIIRKSLALLNLDIWCDKNGDDLFLRIK